MNNAAENIGTGKVRSNNEAGNSIDMEALLAGLKQEDARNTRMMRSFKWVFIVMIGIYTALMVVNPDPELMLHHRITGICYVVAFALFFLIFRKYYTEFNNIDYSLPSVEMLRQGARRYELRIRRYVNLLLPLLLIDAGLTISEYYRWTSIAPFQRILLIQAFYIPLLIISGFIGYLIWRKRQKPLLDGARDLLKQLNEE